MKLKLLFFTLGISLYSFSQVPAGYYNTATGTAYTLKTQLFNIIKNHTDKEYAGLYVTYQASDRDYYYENDGSILDMYSENPTGVDPYNYSADSAQRCGNYSVEGDCYNREHIIPQSIFGSNSPMVSDAHFITPTDGKVNGQRSNYPHGPVASVTWTSKNGSKLGTSAIAGYTGSIFEPIDEFKGDIARMYFYFATRYENTVSGYNYPMFNGTSDQVFTTAFLNMLLTWSAQDPVSQREIDRNNAIYAQQNNRNPYIDHPEYVQLVWNPTPDYEAPTAASNLTITSFTDTTISLTWTAGTDNVAVTSYDIYVNGIKKTAAPATTVTIIGLTPSTNYSIYVIAKDAATNASPASNTVNEKTGEYVPDTQAPTEPTNLTSTNTTSTKVSLTWTAGIDNIAVTSYDIYVNGSLNASVSGNLATISDLTASTMYSFYVIARDAAGNSSVASNIINETTKAAGTDSVFCANESFEKIPTSSTSYTTRTWTGDSDIDWTATLARTDLTLNTRAIVLKGELSTSIASYGIGNFTVTTQLNYSGTSGTFKLRVNGNVVGTIPYSATATTTTITGINIAGDVTISITDNSTSSNRVAFDDLSWTCYSGLGINSLSKNEFKIYPNPSNGNFNVQFDESNANHSVEIFSLLGQKVFEKKETQNSIISVTNLQKGTYLIKLSKGSKSRTEKIIIN